MILLLLRIVAVAIAIIGTHGLYIYFARIEALFSGKLSDLYLAFETPPVFWAVIERVSYWGLQSFFMPTLITVVAIMIWWQSESVAYYIRKIL